VSTTVHTRNAINQAKEDLTEHRTFFQNTDTWPLHDNADPLNGWSLNEVENRSSGPATADNYGKLFYHVREMLRTFVLRLSDLQISFRMLHVDASSLLDHLEESTFSRIEVRLYLKLA